MDWNKILDFIGSIPDFSEMEETTEKKLKNLVFRILYDNEDVSVIKKAMMENGGKELYLSFENEFLNSGMSIIKQMIEKKQYDLLYEIYQKTIIRNKSRELFKKLEKDYSSNQIKKVADELGRLTQKLIIYNNDGEEMVNILSEIYHLPLENADLFGKLFDDNRIELKLNYLIGSLNQ